MQLTWVIKNNSDKLIIFFNGWSLDENIVKHLSTAEFNVLIFNDYSDLEIDEETIKMINSYAEVNIIAWSFGVWACGIAIEKIFNAAQSKLFSPEDGGLGNPPYANDSSALIAPRVKNLKNVIAINGTLVPIDNNLGIPEKIFNLTLQHLSEENYVRFFKNMFTGEADLSKISTRSIENKRRELEQIKNLSASKTCTQNAKYFNKVFIGINDKIISGKNQLNFWGETDAKVIQVDDRHYIFDLFKTWDEIING